MLRSHFTRYSLTGAWCDMFGDLKLIDIVGAFANQFYFVVVSGIFIAHTIRLLFHESGLSQCFPPFNMPLSEMAVLRISGLRHHALVCSLTCLRFCWRSRDWPVVVWRCHRVVLLGAPVPRSSASPRREGVCRSQTPRPAGSHPHALYGSQQCRKDIP